MTDGRFETTYNLRNSTFEKRPFWADTHKLPQELRQSLKEAESCPYHDLRADGAFMPVHDGAGGVSGGHGHIKPEDLVKRNGARMNTHLARSKATGTGGYLIPEDIDPLPPQEVPKRNAAPWTSTGKSKGAFSTPPYISAPNIEKPSQQYEPPFHTGASGSKLHTPYAYVPEQPAKQSPPRAFRLKAGTYKSAPLPPVERLRGLQPEYHKIADKEASPKQKKTTFKQRDVYRDRKTLQGTFGRVNEHMPTPYEEPHLGADRRGGTLFTYWAKSKREQPVQAPWDSAPNAVRSTGQ